MANGWYGEPANRLLDAHEKMTARLDDMPQTARDTLRRKADLSTSELHIFQAWKSRAQVEELLSLDEALTVYGWLGEDQGRDEMGWPIDTDLAARIVTTTLMLELGARFVGVAVKP